MSIEDYHDFFVAAASAAGALIGLLFVALSVWQDRDESREQSEAHRLRAAATLTVFTNALTVSLFALVPGDGIGQTGSIVAGIGLLFILTSALRLLRLRRDRVRLRLRDLVFLLGGTALFGFELLASIGLWEHPHRLARVENLADLVVFSLLYGIARAWEIVGGPQLGFVREARALVRGEATSEEDGAGPADPGADAASPPAFSGEPGTPAPGPAGRS